jgi:hypothetical protein
MKKQPRAGEFFSYQPTVYLPARGFRTCGKKDRLFDAPAAVPVGGGYDSARHKNRLFDVPAAAPASTVMDGTGRHLENAGKAETPRFGMPRG